MGEHVRSLRVNAVEMLRQPGARREIDVAVDPESIEVAHARLAGDVTVDVHLESLNDGITIVGEVRAPWSGPCRRCLRELRGVAVAPVDELYQRVVTAVEAFPIEANQLDLVPMVRQAILLELDVERLCSEDCAGLCPVCGADRNEESCECTVEQRDERWAALDQLVIDD